MARLPAWATPCSAWVAGVSLRKVTSHRVVVVCFYGAVACAVVATVTAVLGDRLWVAVPAVLAAVICTGLLIVSRRHERNRRSKAPAHGRG
jgi:Flp pilus assembly protein TadB